MKDGGSKGGERVNIEGDEGETVILREEKRGFWIVELPSEG